MNKFIIIFSIFFSLSCSAQDDTNRNSSQNSEHNSGTISAPAAEEILAQAEALPELRSLLIGNSDSLYHQWYVNGGSPGEPHNMKSASKAVINTLYGIALEEEWIDSLNTPVADFLPEYFDSSMPDQKLEITLEDLLTMRSGLESTSFNNYGRWIASSDWIAYQINAELQYQPGTVMNYSTGNSHLLGVILACITGQNLHQLAQTYVLNPMGETIPTWDRDPLGNFLGGNNMHFSPESLYNLGRIYANGGFNSNGERLFGSDWIDKTFTAYGSSNFNNHGYGYHWWIDEYNGYETRFAWGHGGQYLFWVPEIDLLAVTTSSNAQSGSSHGHRRQIFELLEEKILPYFEANV